MPIQFVRSRAISSIHSTKQNVPRIVAFATISIVALFLASDVLHVIVNIQEFLLRDVLRHAAFDVGVAVLITFHCSIIFRSKSVSLRLAATNVAMLLVESILIAMLVYPTVGFVKSYRNWVITPQDVIGFWFHVVFQYGIISLILSLCLRLDARRATRLGSASQQPSVG